MKLKGLLINVLTGFQTGGIICKINSSTMGLHNFKRNTYWQSTTTHHKI